MTTLQGRTIHIAGAGVLGLSIAVELAEAGAAVTVHDPSPETSASAAAAGMLAPAFEAVLDPLSTTHFDLFRAARDLWPDFAARVGIMLDRSGARYHGAREDEIAAALVRLGATHEVSSEGVFTPEDWRLEPARALARLTAYAGRLGVVFEEASVEQPIVDADTVAATGWRRLSWAPETLAISAIKGQIIRLPETPPFAGKVHRQDGGYIAPGETGVLYGATMQPGLTDLAPDDAACELMALLGAAPDAGGHIRVGIRGATPDGLPLVGPSIAPGVWLAMGARRNGWLLAPLVARMTLHYLAGKDPGPWAPAMNARRFTAP